MTRPYTQEFKDAMVQKLLSPNGPSATQLAAESGVSQTSLSTWKRRALDKDPSMTPSSLSPARKLELLLEARALQDERLGVFLRTHGLHQADLDSWQAELASLLDPVRTRDKERAQAKLLADHKREHARLTRELGRKDKALAETAALLVLQKKVRQIWGDEDDATT